MLIKSFKTSQCANGCALFNDDSKYIYWENRKTTTDEIEIVDFINKNRSFQNLKILHIGIGNSFVASNIKKYSMIDGITISGNEVNFAKKLNKKNYNVFFLNKFTHEGFLGKNFKNYDMIIDVNLKSFSCCDIAFDNLFTNYVNMLNKNGAIFTGKKGMNWSRIVKPVISFSFKKFFYKKLKEFDGKERNLLKIENCLKLTTKHGMEFYENKNSNVVYFKVLG